MKTLNLYKILSWKHLFFTLIALFITWDTHSQQDSLFLHQLLIPQKNNSKKMTDSIVQYKPDGSPYRRWVYTYNTQGLYTKMLAQDFVPHNYWTNSYVLSLNYNQNGLCTEELYQKFDKDGEPYDYKRYKYFYNNFDLDSVICQTEYGKVDTLENNYKKSYVYTIKKLKKYLAKESYNRWDYETKSWSNSQVMIDTFLYNSRGLLSEKIYRVGKVKTYKYIYSYNENNLLTEVLGQRFILHKDSTVNDTLFTYSYDENGYITEYDCKFWDRTNEKWINYKKYTYEYNDNYQKMTQTLFSWNSLEEIFKCLNIYESEYDIDGNELRRFYINCNGEKGTYYVFYYSDFVDIIENNATTTTTVYPNPSNDQLKIETGNEVIKEIILYDLTGKQIKHLLINEINASIDISDLYKGMYFIQIKTEKGEVKKKFIKL
jgi:hypothetical protein